MQLARPACATDSKRFGRARLRELVPPQSVTSRAADDLRLFATTFLGGFVVVSILIG